MTGLDLPTRDFPCITPTGAERTRYGERPRYAEGLYDLGHGVYAWMVPNGSWGEANAGLVTGDGASLLIETLWDVPKTKAMLAAMQPLTATAPIRTVVNTHGDGDHFYGNQLVGDAHIVASNAAVADMHRHPPDSMAKLSRVGGLLSALPMRSAREIGHWFTGIGAPYDYASVTPTYPTRTFSGSLTLDAGGREVRLIEAGPAHSPGDTFVHVPHARTVFAADIVFLGSTPVMWAGPLANWIEALDTLLDMDVDTVVPGHGPITDKRGVEKVKAYWKFVGPELQRRLADGMAPAQAASDFALSDAFARSPFAGWDSPERIMTNAHTLARELDTSIAPPGQLGLINMLRKQALLAHRLPISSPRSMRLGG